MKPFFHKEKMAGATSAGVRAVNERIPGIEIPRIEAHSAGDALALKADSAVSATLRHGTGKY